MEVTAADTAQGGLPVEARPGVAASSLTGITLGALLVKDQRASSLRAELPETCEKPLPPGFAVQLRHSWRTSFLMKTLQPSEPQLAVALLPEGGCLVTGF